MNPRHLSAGEPASTILQPVSILQPTYIPHTRTLVSSIAHSIIIQSLYDSGLLLLQRSMVHLLSTAYSVNILYTFGSNYPGYQIRAHIAL